MQASPTLKGRVLPSSGPYNEFVIVGSQNKVRLCRPGEALSLGVESEQKAFSRTKELLAVPFLQRGCYKTTKYL